MGESTHFFDQSVQGKWILIYNFKPFCPFSDWHYAYKKWILIFQIVLIVLEKGQTILSVFGLALCIQEMDFDFSDCFNRFGEGFLITRIHLYAWMDVIKQLSRSRFILFIWSEEKEIVLSLIEKEPFY